MVSKTSAQCLKRIKNFLCFPKQFFFKKRFYRYGQCSFDRPAKLFLLNYRNLSEKSQQKMQKLFKNFFFKLIQWGVRKQLQSLADPLPTVRPKFSARFSNGINKLYFFQRKEIHPRVSFETEIPVLTKTPKFSIQNPGRLSVKIRKRLEE